MNYTEKTQCEKHCVFGRFMGECLLQNLGQVGHTDGEIQRKGVIVMKKAILIIGTVVLAQMDSQGIPDQVADSIETLLDCNVYFFGEPVSEPMMYLILAGSGILLLGIYILLNAMKKKS